MEFVGSRLGHGVDVARREPAILNVIRRQLDGHLVDSVERERHALRRVPVAVQTEAVIEADAVNGKAVETGAGAAALNSICSRAAAGGLIEIDPRVGPNDIFDVAVDRRLRLKVGKAEHAGRSDRDRGRVDLLGCDDDDIRCCGA